MSFPLISLAVVSHTTETSPGHIIFQIHRTLESACCWKGSKKSISVLFCPPSPQIVAVLGVVFLEIVGTTRLY